MVATGRVGICIDELLGRCIASILRQLGAPGTPNIQDIRDLALAETSDEVLLRDLGRLGFAAIVTKDSSMLSASVRRAAWRLSGISVFLCDGKWGNLSLFQQARRLIWWWPELVEQASAGPQGGAWRIPAEWKPNGLQQVFVDPTH